MSCDQLRRWLGERTEEMVALQALLTSAPALAPEYGGQGEWEKARRLEAWLRQRGLPPAMHYDTPDARVPEGTRPNFVVTLPGRAAAPAVWVMTHVDVVPPGERLPDGSWAGWTGDPFEMRRSGDLLIGRGVEDNQQAMVASVFAALSLPDCGVRPPLPVRLLFVSAEETGSRYGLERLLADHESLFSRRDLIYVPDGGNEDGSLVEVAEKSVLWLRFQVQGRQSHGSTPGRGCNAFRAGAHLACALDARLHERFGVPDALFDPPESTFEPTMHERNVPNVNTVPGEETFCFDCRVLPRYGLDDVLECVRAEMAAADARFGTSTTLHVVQRTDSAPPTPPDCPAVERLLPALREVYGVEGRPMGIGGSTVAVSFRRKGYPAVVWSRTDGTAHQADESCRISNMVGDAQVFAHVFAQIGRAHV